MKKCAIVLIILSLISCNFEKKAIKHNDMMSDNLLYLLKWGNSNEKTNNDDLILLSVDFNIEKKVVNDTLIVFHNKKQILVGDNKNYEFTFEIFNKSYLLITINKCPCGFAGPDEITRENVLIIDLNTNQGFVLNLNMICFTRSYKTLIEYYPSISEQEISEANIKYCSIKEVSTIEKKILLINQNNKTEEHIMREINLPLIIK